jgi:hypothetical protein
MFKKGGVQSRIYLGSILEKDIKDLDSREAYKYLGIEKKHNVQHKNEREKLKKEYLRRLRSVLGTELQGIKLEHLDHWQYQHLDAVLELLTGAKKKCKN